MAARRVHLHVVEDTDQQIVSAIEELNESFLECRTIGHQWSLDSIGPTIRMSAAVQDIARATHHRVDGARIMVCLRCGTLRIDLVQYVWNQTVPYIVARRYQYPTEYRIKGSSEPLYRGVIQAELFRRHWPKPRKGE
jgi:hypothetical protein